MSVVRPVYTTLTEALTHTKSRLMEAKREYDIWATSNPDFVANESEEYRQRRQYIKLLQIELRELNDSTSKYNLTPALPQLSEIASQQEQQQQQVKSFRRNVPTADRIVSKITNDLSYRNKVSNN